VLLVVAGVHVFAALVGVQFTPFVSNAGPAFGIAVLAVAERCSRRVALESIAPATAAISLACVAAVQLHPAQEQDAVQLLIALPGWLLGDSIRVRRRYQTRLVDAARRRAQEREARVRAEERLTLSRDVHDVVSHTLSMIALRSGVARMVVKERPDEVPAALEAIERASRTALDELRTVLRRTRDGNLGLELDDPKLADLETLIDGTRAAGLDVSFRFSGSLVLGDALLESSAFRVVQEALTNVIKHAGATRACVEVRRSTNSLALVISDNGRGAGSASLTSNGMGLTGMRERVGLFGGSLSAGRPTRGGFAVRATFPLSVGKAPDVD
jgi:signal transduction histidine kinase